MSLSLLNHSARLVVSSSGIESLSWFLAYRDNSAPRDSYLEATRGIGGNTGGTGETGEFE
jgi:hypothetical protein